jgi:hypothetical protein
LSESSLMNLLFLSGDVQHSEEKNGIGIGAYRRWSVRLALPRLYGHQSVRKDHRLLIPPDFSYKPGSVKTKPIVKPECNAAGSNV